MCVAVITASVVTVVPAFRRNAELTLMLAFGLGLLGLVLFNHHSLSGVDPPLHPHRGHGHRFRSRAALEFNAVSDGYMLAV